MLGSRAAGVGARPHIAPIQIDAAQLPFDRDLAAPRITPGRRSPTWSGRLSLEELWRAVDKVRVGGRGHAVLVDETGRLLAHGDPAMRASVARGEDLLWHPLIHPQPGATLAGVERYTTDTGVEMLGVARPVGALGWRIIVEQRAVEAFALSTRLERFLVMTVLTGLALTLFIAVVWGRSFVRPLDALMRGTRSLAEGRLQDRVAIAGRDEFTELGRAFNSMADRLVTLQAEAVRQERQATFGRIAAGLVHDLAHPIQNIGNNCRLMLQLYEDPQYRQDFRRMIDREFPAIRRLLEDLRNLARPIPLERFPVDVGAPAPGDGRAHQPDRGAGRPDASTVTAPDDGAGDRRRSLRARTRAAEPAAERAAGDAAERTRLAGDARGGRARGDRGGRHRLRHRRRAPAARLRRLRHHQAPRPRPRPRDLAAHRRAARRDHRRRQRGRQGIGLHAVVPGDSGRSACCSRRLPERRNGRPNVERAPRVSRRSPLASRISGLADAYRRGRTASFICFGMRAFTTVLAGILMGSPVAGLRPMRALVLRT